MPVSSGSAVLFWGNGPNFAPFQQLTRTDPAIHPGQDSQVQIQINRYMWRTGHGEKRDMWRNGQHDCPDTPDNAVNERRRNQIMSRTRPHRKLDYEENRATTTTSQTGRHRELNHVEDERRRGRTTSRPGQNSRFIRDSCSFWGKRA